MGQIADAEREDYLNEIRKKEESILGLQQSVNSLKRQNRILTDCKSKNAAKLHRNYPKRQSVGMKKSESRSMCGYFKRFIQFLFSFVLFVCAMALLFDQINWMDSSDDQLDHNITKMGGCVSICQ